MLGLTGFFYLVYHVTQFIGSEMKNVYIVSEVLSDYTSGMVVIVASDLSEARSLFLNEFEDHVREYDSAISNNKYQVISTNIHQESRVVSYVYGGG